MNNFPYELEIDEYYDSDLEDIINSCKSGYLISNTSSAYNIKKPKDSKAERFRNHILYLQTKKRDALIKEKRKREEQKIIDAQYSAVLTYVNTTWSKEKIEKFYKSPECARLIDEFLKVYGSKDKELYEATIRK